MLQYFHYLANNSNISKPTAIINETFMKYNDMSYPASRLTDRHLINICSINHTTVTNEAGNTS